MDVSELAGLITECVVIDADPKSAFSPPFRRHAESAVRPVIGGLARHLGAERGLRRLWQDLRSLPESSARAREFRDRVIAALSISPQAHEALAGPATDFAQRTRLRFQLGQHDHEPHLTDRRLCDLRSAMDNAGCTAGAPRGLAGTPEICVVMDVRATPSDASRLENAVAALVNLLRSPERRRFHILLVEQDAEARTRHIFEPYVDSYVFAPNSGPYNRSWAHNVGVIRAPQNCAYICLLDADIIVPQPVIDSMFQAIEALSAPKAVLPYSSVLYADADSTRYHLDCSLMERCPEVPADRLRGYRLIGTKGGLLLVETRIYLQLNGYDESFSGWGEEDNDFFGRLAAACDVLRLDGELIHLHHDRAPVVNDAERPHRP